MIRTMTFIALMVLHIGANAETIQLFQPGQTSFEWLLSDHEGGSSLRKGMSCQQCHDASDKELFKDSLAVDMKLSDTDKSYLVTLSWTSDASNVDVSLMFDNNEVKAFQRTGCWASCHGDMKGMKQSMDLPKYLGASRQKITRSGGGKNYQNEAAIKQLMADGQYVELWHAAATPEGTKIEQSTILKAHEAMKKPSVKADATRNGNKWTVTFEQPKTASEGKALISEGQYTMGLAIHQNTAGHDHWVSLPQSLTVKNGKLSLTDQ